MSNAREYYDRTSREYLEKWRRPGEEENGTLYLRRRLIESLVDLADVREGERLVEIGSGTGLVLRAALQRTRPVYGTDISVEMLKRARDDVLSEHDVSIVDRFEPTMPPADVYLMVNDFRELDLPRGFFDVILSLEVLRYVDDVDRALRAVRTIAGPQTRFVFSVTNLFSSSLFPAKFSVRNLLGRVDPDRELLQYFETESSIRRKVRDAGFRVTAFKRDGLPLLRKIALRPDSSGGEARKVERRERSLAEVPLLRGLYDTFLVAVRPR